MKKLFALLAFLTLTCLPAKAQQQLSQSFSMFPVGAPPAVVSGQSYSASSGTGASTATSGGSVAAGSYRVCVTLFSATNTETPCSTDTAATAVITTTGSTSTLTVYPPVNVNGGGNVVGYRIYIGASAGASGAETLQTINATLCTLSTSSTPSCSLNSSAVFTSSTGFTSGSGGPASPGTLLFTPISNAANTPLFENSLFYSHIITWTVSGTAPSACTFSLQTGSTIAGLANVGQAITCTATGSYAVPYVTTNAYSAINVSAFTAGGTNTNVVFTETVLPYILPLFWGNANPTSACAAGMGLYQNTSNVSGTGLFYCATTTWTAVTEP
jgi:hypothetical protein